MEERAIEHLETVLGRGTNFKFGEYISKGFTSWKTYAGGYIGFGILFMIISLILGMVPFIGTIASSLLISPALTLGSAMVAHKIHNGEKAEFGDFWKGFNFAGPIIITYLVLFGIYLLLLIPFGVIAGTSLWPIIQEFSSGNPDPSIISDINIGAGSMLLVLPFIFGAVCLSFTLYFIGFYDLKGINAIKYSFKFIIKHWLLFFLFLIVCGLITSLGLLAIVIGILITLTITWPMLYEAFNDLTALDEYTGNTDGTFDAV